MEIYIKRQKGVIWREIVKNWCMKGGHLGESRTKQWGQWVKVVCKKGANVSTHSRHYFSESPRD